MPRKYTRTGIPRPRKISPRAAFAIQDLNKIQETLNVPDTVLGDLAGYTDSHIWAQRRGAPTCTAQCLINLAEALGYEVRLVKKGTYNGPFTSHPE
jgi:hypothetical protein